MKRISIFLVFALLILVGCNETPNKDSTKQAELVDELNQTKSKLETATNEIENLEKKISDLEEIIENSKSTSVLDGNPIFNWMHESNWDEIVVTGYYPDYDVEKPIIKEVRINNAMVKTRPDSFFFGIIRYTEPEDPGSGGRYRYVFKQGSDSYLIDLYDSHCFKYEGTFYYCIGNIDDLANAFIADGEGIINNENYIEFIYNSTVLLGEKIHQFPYYSKKRIQSIAVKLKKYHVIDRSSINDIGELIEAISFFNHGETAKVTIYENCININFRSQDIWLQGDSQLTPISLTYILGAN